MTLAGLKLATRRQGMGTTPIIVVLVGLSWIAATAVADLSLQPATQPADGGAKIPVLIEVVEAGQSIQLTLNGEQAAQIASLVKPAGNTK
jgi:hypothetical protein